MYSYRKNQAETEVVQLTPFINCHSLRTVLAVPDHLDPFVQTGLLCN